MVVFTARFYVVIKGGKRMNSPCPNICDNKNTFGYCNSTACVNPKYNATTITAKITQSGSYLAMPCLICGDSVMLTSREEMSLQYGRHIHSKVCDKCREAVLCMREQMEMEKKTTVEDFKRLGYTDEEAEELFSQIHIYK